MSLMSNGDEVSVENHLSCRLERKKVDNFWSWLIHRLQVIDLISSVLELHFKLPDYAIQRIFIEFKQEEIFWRSIIKSL